MFGLKERQGQSAEDAAKREAREARAAEQIADPEEAEVDVSQEAIQPVLTRILEGSSAGAAG